MKKNDIYEITIEDIGNDGEGIGRIDGMAVFVKDTVMGDVAKVKIIKAKAAKLNADIPEDVIAFIAENINVSSKNIVCS